MIAFDKAAFLASRTPRLCGESVSTRDSPDRIARRTRQLAGSSAVGTLLSLLDALATNLESDNGAHDTDGSASNGGCDLIDCRADDDTLQTVEECIAGANSGRVKGHAADGGADASGAPRRGWERTERCGEGMLTRHLPVSPGTLALLFVGEAS